MDDVGAHELLERVTGSWVAAGVLGVLRELVDQVWQRDLARFDPGLGDDAMSLGMQASRNLCNLAVRRLQDLPGVTARDRRTLEITYADRVLHVSKAPSESPTWEIDQLDWAASEVREYAATANTTAYQSSAGTLFEDWDSVPGQNHDPSALRHLHLTWQGLADGSTRAWLGFPQLGLRPWYAVVRLDQAGGVAGAGTRPPAPVVGYDVPLPAFDDLSEPDVRVVRRRDPVRRDAPGEPGGEPARRGGHRPPGA